MGSGSRHQWYSRRPGRTGAGGIEGSVNPSRGPARPNRVHRIAVSSTRFDSSIADFDSRHRALSVRRRELGHGAIRGPARRAPRGVPRLKGMWRLLRPKPRLEESPYLLTRVLGSRSGTRARFVDGRTPAACDKAHRARASFTARLHLDQEAKEEHPCTAKRVSGVHGWRSASEIFGDHTQPLRAVTVPLMLHAEMAPKPPE